MNLVGIEGTLEKACEAYNDTYATKIKPEAVRKCYQRKKKREAKQAA